METDLQPPVQKQDHVQGPDPARVTLLQYGDYECPVSRKIYEIVPELWMLRRYGLEPSEQGFDLPTADRSGEMAVVERS